MAFYYGKPSPEIYHEIASHNIIRNLVKRCNEKGGWDAERNATLHGAIIMLESQGFRVTLTFEEYLQKWQKLDIIEFVTIENIETDEVYVFQFDTRIDITRGCFKDW